MKTLDLKKQYRELYLPPARKVTLIRVPKLKFVMIDGKIEKGQGPSTSVAFQESMQALYGIAYTLKFMMKLRPKNAVNYPVMALEGLWWVENGSFDISVQDNWHFNMMIMQPDIITPALFRAGLAELRRKRGDAPALKRLRLAAFAEGLCVQTMHIGPYASEPATVERMRAYAADKGYIDLVELGGKHHEIYMGDPRKADPSKLKTVVRHPVRKMK
jgi:hypothetical protein